MVCEGSVNQDIHELKDEICTQLRAVEGCSVEHLQKELEELAGAVAALPCAPLTDRRHHYLVLFDQFQTLWSDGLADFHFEGRQPWPDFD